MRILYIINTGIVGGLQKHVLCLMQSLCGIAETAVVLNAVSDPHTVGLFADNGQKTYLLNGKSGHDPRIISRFDEIVRDFKPDVIHAHGLPMILAIAMLIRRTIFGKIYPIVSSIHTPTRKPSLSEKLRNRLLDKVVDYWLPVSNKTWVEFLKFHHDVKGEVFYNPLHVNYGCNLSISKKRVIGMVGRNADQKDWPSFHKVADLVGVEAWNLGENEFCSNARERIGQMTVFVMTSKHEQLPTTMLECFSMKTAICGFIPEGGTSDVLQYSNGALKEVFIEERSCEKLSEIVKRLLADEDLRNRVIEDGWQILTNHFDAEKNCRGRLMDIYKKMLKEIS